MNASPSILTTLSGILIDERLRQFMKALLPINSMLPGNTMDVTLWQLRNASLPMVVTLLEVNDEKNLDSPLDWSSLALAGIITLPS